MACHDCGDCRYDDQSYVDLLYRVTSDGLQCPPDVVISHNHVPYNAPGHWEQQLPDNTKVIIKSKCNGGAWSYNFPPPTPPDDDDERDCAWPAEQDHNVNVPQDDCMGYRRQELTTFVDGAWMRIEVYIDVRNNGNC